MKMNSLMSRARLRGAVHRGGGPRTGSCSPQSSARPARCAAASLRGPCASQSATRPPGTPPPRRGAGLEWTPRHPWYRPAGTEGGHRGERRQSSTTRRARARTCHASPPGTHFSCAGGGTLAAPPAPALRTPRHSPTGQAHKPRGTLTLRPRLRCRRRQRRHRPTRSRHAYARPAAARADSQG